MSALYYQFQKYTRLTPTFKYLKNLLFDSKPIKVDHIAHRSLNYIDFNTLVSYYVHNNFKLQKEKYTFHNMNVEAQWLKSDRFRVFTSYFKGNDKYNIRNYQDYKTIQKENDYIAWTMLHKNDINHVAISVDDIEEVIKKIKQDGTIKLNNESNPIEVSNDGKLLQASTIADRVPYKFPDGELHLVPYTFVEFIQRIDGREGFETKNAAKIFTSTKQ